MRVEVSLHLPGSRDYELRVQQTAITGGSATRCSDWYHHLVGDGSSDLVELLLETEMDRGACGMHRRAGQFSFDLKTGEQSMNPGDCVDDLDLTEPLLSLAVDVGSYIVQEAVSA